MSRYSQLPPDRLQAPATVWQWAADLDKTAQYIQCGRIPGACGPDGRPFLPSTYRDLAATLRVNALTGALLLDGVPVMEEGWALAPHPVRVAQREAPSHAGDCPHPVTIPPLADFDTAVMRLYEELDRAARSCRRGSQAPELCAPCTDWAERHLARWLPVR